MLGTFHIESLCQQHHPGGRRWRFFVLSHRKHQTLPVKKFPNTPMCLGKIKIWKAFNAGHMFQFLLDGLSMVVGEVVRNHLALLLEVYLTIGRGKAPFLSRIVRKIPASGAVSLCLHTTNNAKVYIGVLLHLFGGIHSEILFAQMGEFFRVTLQNFLQGDAAHGFLRSDLYQVVTVPQCQLYVHTHATIGVGVDVLMEQGLVALYCPIGIQQSDFLRFTS